MMSYLILVSLRDLRGDLVGKLEHIIDHPSICQESVLMSQNHGPGSAKKQSTCIAPLEQRRLGSPG